MAKNVVGHLVYKITGDSKELNASLKSSQDRTAKFTRFIKSALGIGGAVLAVRALIRIGKDLIKTYGVQEQAETRLAAAIRATGGDVEELMTQYTEFASEIQQVTTIGDEQTLGLLQTAQSLGITRSRMQEATKGAIGLSKAFGLDMKMALRGVALAYEGNYTQLSRYIPALRTAGDEAERQAILQEAMTNGFQIARAEAESGTGAMLQLQNSIGDLKEQGGKMLTEFLTPSIRSLTEFVTRTTAAIAESQKLKKIAKDLAEGEPVTAVDEIALLSKEIKEAELEYKGMGKAAEAYAEFVGEGYGVTKKGIALMKARLGKLQDIARWEAIGAEAKSKMNAEELADEEEKAKKAQEMADWTKMVLEGYRKTEESQRAILEAEIAKWEYELSRANKYKPQIQAIVDMLYEERDANVEITDTWKERLAEMTAETDAAMVAYQLRLDAEQAYQEELAAIRERARKKERTEAEKLKADKEKLQQAALDSFVAIWGELRSLQDQKTRYEITQLERQQAAELAGFQGTEEEKQTLMEQFEKEKAMVEYEGALKSWKLQLTGALAAFARSIIESMKLGFPWAIPMVAMATLMGGIQVAAVRKAKPVPAFATGADFIVPPGYPNDSYIFRAESGEHVEVTPPAKAAASSMFHVSIYFAGRHFYDEIRRASEDGSLVIHPRSIRK